ncbi:hypothetical protein UJ101_01736 [Flavobacteriaceae bacterium UJ101]|nr:hypothetical protein UJ101_01736 [Flavobacteriaceae bacterium UJ101]
MKHLDQEQKIKALFQEINPKPSDLDQKIMQQISQNTTQNIAQQRVYHDIFKPIVWYSIIGFLILLTIYVLSTVFSYVKIDTLSWTIFLGVLTPFSIDFYLKYKNILTSK